MSNKVSKSMKEVLWGAGVGALALVIAAFLLGRYAFPDNASTDPAALPTPEVASGQLGELGIDKNINTSTNLDDYLGRSDIVYRDVRMLQDPGNYASIGGDANLSGFIEGFEVVPFPYLVNVTGLPESVGNTYQGDTLFTETDGVYTPNYAESIAILEALFPKDQTLFLMCGGGGYAGMLKNMLVSLGWNADQIYDVGGYWYYNGDHNIEVARTTETGETVYDFYKVPYHNIDFTTLTEVDNGD